MDYTYQIEKFVGREARIYIFSLCPEVLLVLQRTSGHLRAIFQLLFTIAFAIVIFPSFQLLFSNFQI